jgi:hypothetical protein
MSSLSFLRLLNYVVLLTATLPHCYGKVGKTTSHISSIYINTPDSSVKAFVTDRKQEKTTVGRMYFWYSANQLCYSNGSYSGRLLHGQYSSFYPNHFLLSQGQFSNGLKQGSWKRWFSNGSIHEIINYRNGLLHGAYELYSPNGHLEQRIYYRDGVRAGKTTFFSQDGKDSVILYKKGVPVVKKDGRREIVAGGKTRVKNDSIKKEGRWRLGNGSKTRVKNDSVKKDGRRKFGDKNKSRDSLKIDSSPDKLKRQRKLKWNFGTDSAHTPVSRVPTPGSK